MGEGQVSTACASIRLMSTPVTMKTHDQSYLGNEGWVGMCIGAASREVTEPLLSKPPKTGCSAPSILFLKMYLTDFHNRDKMTCIRVDSLICCSFVYS